MELSRQTEATTYVGCVCGNGKTALKMLQLKFNIAQSKMGTRKNSCVPPKQYNSGWDPASFVLSGKM